jgi:uncharacterized repeat protein (TIGR03803 family)
MLRFCVRHPKPAARSRRRILLACVRAVSLACLVTLGFGAGTAAYAGAYKLLYSFSGGADGTTPFGQLAIGKDRLLYGATLQGGAAGGGTVFRLDPASGILTTLYSFTGGADGFLPAAGVVIDGKGMVYGTTEEGGSFACPDRSGCGTVYKLDPSTGALTTLLSFPGGTAGSQPSGALLLYGGVLYGTTQLGGFSSGPNDLGSGTLFKLDPKTKTLTTLHEFNLPGVLDGESPESSLTVGSDGRLYGSASEGGPHNSGTVYAIDPASDAFSLLHGFDYHVDGFGPDCRVIFLKGQIIGTTRAGGPTQAVDGTVFSLDPSSGVLTTLHSFTGTPDGQSPLGGVVRGPKGLLYGVASQGGKSGAGTVFAVNPKTGKFTLLHDFDGNDGAQPSGELLLDDKNIFYGVTQAGGRGHGTVYEIIP